MYKNKLKKPIFVNISVILTLALGLNACSPATPTADPTQTLQAVYTAAAITMTAQAALFTATPQPSPTSTVTPTISPTNTPAVTATTSGFIPGPASGDLSAYQADVTIPDDTQMVGGAAFTKTWKMYNKGTTTWTTSYKIAFVSGDSMSGTTTPLSRDVRPGESADVSVNMIAPIGSGTKTGYWRLQNATGAFFGDQVSVKIIIGGTAGPTGTVTATATSGTPAATAIPSQSHVVVSGDTCDSLAAVQSIDPIEFATNIQLLNTSDELLNICNKLVKGKIIDKTILIPK